MLPIIGKEQHDHLVSAITELEMAAERYAEAEAVIGRINSLASERPRRNVRPPQLLQNEQAIGAGIPLQPVDPKASKKWNTGNMQVAPPAPNHKRKRSVKTKPPVPKFNTQEPNQDSETSVEAHTNVEDTEQKYPTEEQKYPHGDVDIEIEIENNEEDDVIDEDTTPWTEISPGFGMGAPLSESEREELAFAHDSKHFSSKHTEDLTTEAVNGTLGLRKSVA